MEYGLLRQGSAVAFFPRRSSADRLWKAGTKKLASPRLSAATSLGPPSTRCPFMGNRALSRRIVDPKKHAVTPHAPLATSALRVHTRFAGNEPSCRRGQPGEGPGHRGRRRLSGAPRAGGNIPGNLPLEVTFNTCPSRDPDPGDQLKTTYDFDGDGTIDFFGHCRQTHVFDVPARPRICVTDRTPDHAVCRTFVVGGGSDPVPTPCPRDGRASLGEVEPNGSTGVAMGPFADSVLISGDLSGDGDDAFSFVNNCEVPIIIQARTFGPGGPGDCSAPPSARVLLFQRGEGGGVGNYSPVGSTCTMPNAAVGLQPGSRVRFEVTNQGVAPPAYVLQILMAPGTFWRSDHPLE